MTKAALTKKAVKKVAKIPTKKGTKKTAKKTVKKDEQRKKLAIFIDGNNFRHGIKALLKNENIDWKQFLKEIERDYDLTQVNYYIGKLTHPLFEQDKVTAQEKLLKEFKKVGIVPSLGYFNDDKNEKGVDVQIALDLAIGSVKGNFDIAMLISGDGDLSKAVKIAQMYKVRVILGYVAGIKGRSYRISWILKEITDSQAALNDQIKSAHESWKKKNPEHKTDQKKVKKSAEKKAAAEKKKGATKKKTKEKAPAAKTTKLEKEKGKTHDHVFVFSDGGARGNPGPSGCGAVVTDEKGNVLKKVSEFIGHSTNNQAEYMALLFGLDAAAKLKPKKISCYLDSKLAVEQICGRWKVKNKELQEYHQQVQLFLKDHKDTSFHHIPREKNKMADQLANDAMDRGK